MKEISKSNLQLDVERNKNQIFNIGIFTCFKKLGIGATSVVYLGKKNQSIPNPEPLQSLQEGKVEDQLGPDQLIAIKIFKRSATRQFNQEVLVYQKVISNNLVRCFGYYKEIPIKNNNDQIGIFNCLVLEYAEQGEFFWFAENTPLNEITARFYFKSMLKGVNTLHSAGFAHYDLKLENMFLDSHFNLKIGDFGASYDLEKMPKRISGTKSYRAPEYYRSQHLCGQVADVFSLGVILFVLITGKMPFFAPIQTDPYYKYLIDENPNMFWQLHEYLLQRTKTKSKQEQTGNSIVQRMVIVDNQPQIIWEYSNLFKDIITKMIQNNPQNRITITEVYKHPWTQQESNTCAGVIEEMIKKKTKSS